MVDWLVIINTLRKQKKIRESQLRSKSHLFGKPSTFKNKKHSEEAKKKISKAKEGLKLTKEHKKKVSESLKGRIFSEEHKEKISSKLKGRFFSEEHRRKISNTKKRRFLERKNSEQIKEVAKTTQSQIEDLNLDYDPDWKDLKESLSSIKEQDPSYNLEDHWYSL